MTLIFRSLFCSLVLDIDISCVTLVSTVEVDDTVEYVASTGIKVTLFQFADALPANLFLYMLEIRMDKLPNVYPLVFVT